MPPLPSARQRAERRGRFGEGLAALYLRLQFYRILATRVKTPVGEIDLIARRGRTVIFVEVKLRRNITGLGAALDAVNRRRIGRAAQYFLTRHPKLTDYTLRFDVIFLAPFVWPHHVKGAFETLE